MDIGSSGFQLFEIYVMNGPASLRRSRKTPNITPLTRTKQIVEIPRVFLERNEAIDLFIHEVHQYIAPPISEKPFDRLEWSMRETKRIDKDKRRSQILLLRFYEVQGAA